jgi:hypothetical protein
MKERLLPILLLIIWIIAGVLPHVQYKIGRSAAREQFEFSKKSIPESAVLTMLFRDYASVNWEKADKEFTVNGKLYDVISIQKSDTALLIRCVSDEKEDAIVAEYQQTLKNSKKDTQQHKDRKFDYYFAAIQRVASTVPVKTKGVEYNASVLSVAVRAIESPPPEIWEI